MDIVPVPKQKCTLSEFRGMILFGFFGVVKKWALVTGDYEVLEPQCSGPDFWRCLYSFFCGLLMFWGVAGVAACKILRHGKVFGLVVKTPEGLCPIFKWEGSIHGSTPKSSLLIMGPLGSRNDDSNRYVPETHVRDLIVLPAPCFNAQLWLWRTFKECTIRWEFFLSFFLLCCFSNK